jgi:hypothetical protein
MEVQTPRRSRSCEAGGWLGLRGLLSRPDARVFPNDHPEARGLVVPRRTWGALAASERRQSVRIAIGLAAAAAVFDIGQYFSADGTPAPADWVASTTGVVAGGFIGFLVARQLPARDS